MSRDLLTPLWTRTSPPDVPARDWERLFSQARRARLLGRVAVLLAERGWLDAVPAAARVHLDNAQRVARRQARIARWEADCLVRAIGHLPTPIVLLKGAAYVMADLAPARGRMFGDIDILVAAPQLAAVEAALHAAGWSAAPMDAYDERFYRDWSHELPPLLHADRGTVLDVHHTLAQPGSRFAVDAGPLLAAAQPLPAQPRLSVLAPADRVLHGAVHLMQEGDFGRGLRDLLDLTDLISGATADDGDFWPALVGRAEALRLTEPLFDALTQARRLLAFDVPSAAWQRLSVGAPQGWRHRLVGRMLSLAMRPDHPDCDVAGTRLARGCLYLRSHRLRLPWHRLLPHLLRKAWLRGRARWSAAAGQG